jgi:hypothetical protein
VRIAFTVSPSSATTAPTPRAKSLTERTAILATQHAASVAA